MGAIQEQLKKPVVIGLVAALLGLALGLLIGWVFWPVEYEGAAPEHLLPVYQAEYLGMAAESYSRNGNLELALARYRALGEGRAPALDLLKSHPGSVPQEAVDAYFLAVQTAEAAGIAPVETPAAATGGGFPYAWLCGLGLVLVIGIGAFFLFRSKGFSRVTPVPPVQPMTSVDEWSEHVTAAGEPPMTRFMASYKLGDDLFDDSFSVDNPAGEFMGECGVGISEVIGVGDPKRVTAFEVWLFDKNDIQTVTKVLMSAHAYNDDSIQARLSTKGEPVLVQEGAEAVLETQTLRMVARVVDTAYGEGPLPEDSFFDRFVLDLAIWSKQPQA